MKALLAIILCTTTGCAGLMSFETVKLGRNEQIVITRQNLGVTPAAVVARGPSRADEEEGS